MIVSVLTILSFFHLGYFERPVESRLDNQDCLIIVAGAPVFSGTE